jgi:hypothetical protein
MSTPVLPTPGRSRWRDLVPPRRHQHHPGRPTDPTFLIIGAQKAGTSWLHRTLGLHDEVLVTKPKELRYFYQAGTYAQGRDWYRGHFAAADEVGARALGESTPNYLWASDHREDEWGDPREVDAARRFRHGMPERIAQDLGTDLRLVVLLRDPVQRAISAFFHHLRKRPHRLDRSRPFADNVRQFGIVQMGFYAAHLERWLEVFPAERFLVLVNEEVRASPAEAVERVHRHLGVRPDAPAEVAAKVHVGTKHGGRGVWYWDAEEREVAIGPDELALLREVYAPENARLARLLGRDPWAGTE